MLHNNAFLMFGYFLLYISNITVAWLNIFVLVKFVKDTL